MVKESYVDGLIVNDLEKMKPDIYWTKKHANIYQQNGVPDYLGVYKGRFFAIEAKAGNGHKLGMAQLFNGYQIAQAGGIFIVAYTDYDSITKMTPVHFNLNLNGEKANKLSDSDYDKLREIFTKINKEKKSIMLVK